MAKPYSTLHITSRRFPRCVTASAIMNKGKIVALDTPDALKGMAKKGEVADIVVKNMSEAQVNSLRGLEGVSGLASEVQDSVLGQTTAAGAFGERGCVADGAGFLFPRENQACQLPPGRANAGGCLHRINRGR